MFRSRWGVNGIRLGITTGARDRIFLLIKHVCFVYMKSALLWQRIDIFVPYKTNFSVLWKKTIFLICKEKICLSWTGTYFPFCKQTSSFTMRITSLRKIDILSLEKEIPFFL